MIYKKEISIIIADDHQIFLDGLIALFEGVENLCITGTAVNGLEVLSLLDTHVVDMVILDINMPEMDGIELNKIIKKEYPNVKTLVLSMHISPDKISSLAKSNANGYLLKNSGKTELLNAIDSIVNQNVNYYSSEVKEEYMNSIFNSKEKPIEELRDREREIIKLIAQEYTTQEIAEKLFISPHTVNTHRKNLLAKLNVKNLAGLVKYAIKNGLSE
ncbi:response regulator [Flavivirga algicola]|uniref:Response regulator transcription factor n=1 Tax=Flavivirga algicola TaxID=2729136 RepID=A0ABX1RR19_9FLAO|nr:response regulator transcription factor [Flavivirga algicola]NMH85981.1 response regulator transcription factor [Flavivirga algicola]